MQYELKTLDDGRVLYLRVVETPPPHVAMALNENMSHELAQSDISRLIVDYRDLVKSDFDAAVARAILIQMERILLDLGRLLHVAMLSTEGTFGHGIARMTEGHAYGLRLLVLRHFTDWDEAQAWLNSEA